MKHCATPIKMNYWTPRSRYTSNAGNKFSYVHLYLLVSFCFPSKSKKVKSVQRINFQWLCNPTDGMICSNICIGKSENITQSTATMDNILYSNQMKKKYRIARTKNHMICTCIHPRNGEMKMTTWVGVCKKKIFLF